MGEGNKSVKKQLKYGSLSPRLSMENAQAAFGEN